MRSVLMKLCGVFEAELLVYYKHRKYVSRAYENMGHFPSREGISRDAGHMGRNMGCPGKYGTVGGNPIVRVCTTKIDGYSYGSTSSSSRMHVIYHNWSATKQRPHPQSVAEITDKPPFSFVRGQDSTM